MSADPANSQVLGGDVRPLAGVPALGLAHASRAGARTTTTTSHTRAVERTNAPPTATASQFSYFVDEAPTAECWWSSSWSRMWRGRYLVFSLPLSAGRCRRGLQGHRCAGCRRAP